jgi:hypothetical protein
MDPCPEDSLVLLAALTAAGASLAAALVYIEEHRRRRRRRLRRQKRVRECDSSSIARPPSAPQPTHIPTTSPTNGEKAGVPDVTNGTQIKLGDATGPTRAFLTADEMTAVMGWCLEHRNQYKVMTKTKFWALCVDFIKKEFSKDVLHPGRMVKTWVDRRRKETEREDGMSAVEHLNNTEFRQRIGIWISFIDDLDRPKIEDARRESSVASPRREVIAKEAGNAIVSRTRSKRPFCTTLETAEDHDNIAQTPTSKSPNPENTKKRVKIKKNDNPGTASSNFGEGVPMSSESAREKAQKVTEEEI